MVDWDVVLGALPDFFQGLRITLTLLALSLVGGFVLAVPLATARVSRRRWLSAPVWFYTYVIRGTPLLVQLFMLYFGLAQFEWIRESAAWTLLRSPWFCAWLAFTLNTAAYTTEIFAGALRNTPNGELEAARSLGLTQAQIYRRILWPGALRRALPQYSNEVVGLMHATAIARIAMIDRRGDFIRVSVFRRVVHVAQNAERRLVDPLGVFADLPALPCWPRLRIIRSALSVKAVVDVDHLAPDVGIGLVQRT